MKKKYPGVPVVAYVNTSAAVKGKAISAVRRQNVVKVVESLKEDTVICIPDRNLSAYAAKRTKKKIISWTGFRNVHMRLDAEDVNKAKQRILMRPSSFIPNAPRSPGNGRPHHQHVGHAQVLQGVEPKGIHHRH